MLLSYRRLGEWSKPGGVRTQTLRALAALGLAETRRVFPSGKTEARLTAAGYELERELNGVVG